MSEQNTPHDDDITGQDATESTHPTSEGGEANAGSRVSDGSTSVSGDHDGKLGDGSADPNTDAESDSNVNRVHVRRLEEENRRLREKYAGAREQRYTRTALGLAVAGVLFGGAGVIVTSAQEILFAIAAAGLFGAVVTRYLTPEQFIPLDIGEGVYAALAENEAELVDQLGLSSRRIYVRSDRGPRLFVPEIDAYDEELLVDLDQLTSPIVVSDSASRSGLLLHPVAEPLLQAFEEQHGGSLPDEPREAVATLSEGVTDALELAGRVDTDLDSDDGRVTFSISDPLYPDATKFDYPIASFLGAGLAYALDTPVEVSVVITEQNGTETPLVTCRWESADSTRADTDE